MKKSKTPSRKTLTPKKPVAPSRPQSGGRRAPSARMAVKADADGGDDAPVSKPRRRVTATKKAAPAVAASKKTPAAKRAAAPLAAVGKPAKVAKAAPVKKAVTVSKAAESAIAPKAKRPSVTTKKAAVAPASKAEATPAARPAATRGVQRVATFGLATAKSKGVDEGRFLFPRTYEMNRVRLVVRDPEWLFAHWDVNPRAFETLRQELGERVAALSRLTLKIQDADGATSEVILLPAGARSWYARIDGSRQRFFAEIGITLPSGQFRTLARSNVVTVPRSGPSTQGAVRSVDFHEAWRQSGLLATGVEDEAAAAAFESSSWPDTASSMGAAPGASSDRLQAEMQKRGAALGGASDLYRR